MDIFDKIKEEILKMFSTGDGDWVRRKSRSSLDIEVCNGVARKDETTNSCELCVALNKTVFKNNNKPLFTHPNCTCTYESYALNEVILDFPMRKIDSYLFKNEDKREMMLSIGYNDFDYQEVYDLVAKNVKGEFLKGNYKLQIFDNKGQRITINFIINGKRNKLGRLYNCHAGCVVWTNGKIKIVTQLILDKEIK